jgi:hypothetical protein
VWPGIQNNLGEVLLIIGQRGTGTRHLEEAIAAFGEALKVWTKEVAPYQNSVVKEHCFRATAFLAQRRNQ